jgi:hypothetical protein
MHKDDIMEQVLGDSTPLPTVLVTGGCGFLGSHLVDTFGRKGRYHVVGLSRHPTVRHAVTSTMPKGDYVLITGPHFETETFQRNTISLLHKPTEGRYLIWYRRWFSCESTFREQMLCNTVNIGIFVVVLMQDNGKTGGTRWQNYATACCSIRARFILHLPTYWDTIQNSQRHTLEQVAGCVETVMHLTNDF